MCYKYCELCINGAPYKYKGKKIQIIICCDLTKYFLRSGKAETSLQDVIKFCEHGYLSTPKNDSLNMADANRF